MRALSAFIAASALLAGATTPAAASMRPGPGCGAAFATCASAGVHLTGSEVVVAGPLRTSALSFAAARPVGVPLASSIGPVVTPPPTTTPEPVSMTLLATGLVGVGLVGRRRRQQAPPPSD